MIVTIPTADEPWFSFKINYDNRVLTCTLYWCEETQAIYDRSVAQIARDAYNDPIVTADGAYIRDYDVREYYQADNPLTNDSLYAEWYDKHKDELAVSLRRYSFDADLRRVVMERSMLYYAINNTINRCEEQCVWTFTISDEGESITGVVNPGAAYERDGRWTMWVHSTTRTRIRRDDLQFVELEFI